MANSAASTGDSDEARDDLLATLAAARELDPDMDKALADRYLERRREEQKRARLAPAAVRQPEQVRAEQWHRPPTALLSFLPIICVILAVTVITSGHFWGLLLIPLLGCFWWWRPGGGYSSSRDQARYQRRMARERYRRDRLAARYGYRPYDENSPTANPTEYI